MEIGLVACTKSKRLIPSIPKDLYLESDLFTKKRKYCESYHQKWYILSAKHHLLDPNGPKIIPYDETLKGAKKAVKEEWCLKVFEQLQRAGLLKHKLIIHTGQDYYKYLIPLLKKADVDFEIPTAHLGIGKQKAWYKEMIEKIS